MPLGFFRRCRIHSAGFSENRPCRVLPTMTEIIVIPSLLFASRPPVTTATLPANELIVVTLPPRIPMSGPHPQDGAYGGAHRAAFGSDPGAWRLAICCRPSHA